MTTQQLAQAMYAKAMQTQPSPEDMAVLILPGGVVRRILMPGAGLPPGPISPGLSEAPLGLRMVPIEETLEDNWLHTGTSTTYGIKSMVNALGADKLILYVISTLDQAVTIQTVGSYIDQPSNTANLINIGSSFSQGAGSSAQSINSIEIYLNQVWHPYLGITVATGSTGPSSGILTVLARGQRWVSGKG